MGTPTMRQTVIIIFVIIVVAVVVIVVNNRHEKLAGSDQVAGRRPASILSDEC